MEYLDSITTSDIAFISQSKRVFSLEEVSFPEDKCNLVAVTVRYGLVFCGSGNTIKVFQTQVLLDEEEPQPLTVIDAGLPVTHLSTSSDGFALLAIVLMNDKPRALFYETRFLIPGCGSQSPFAVTSLNGAGVQAVCWNPMDPCTVAIASAPEDLSLVTIKDDAVDVKSKPIKARALSWSPKGKQLCVGLADGALNLFKPDLQLVRGVKSPPMDGVSAVQSITWFSNTEFFIGYKQESEEGGQVMMYVNAPKAQEPKYVVYEFICNENLGDRPAMFYQTFFQEWNILCLASSRDAQLGVIGVIESEGGGWCEYELEEGKKASMHCINITETTYALGMAIDFTSQKTFSSKDDTVSGPFPVIFVLSTGGELNIFHIRNNRPGVDTLVAPPEALPKTGFRTIDQYKGSIPPSLFMKPTATASPASKSLFMSSTPVVPSLGSNSGAPKMMPAFSSGSTLGGSLFGDASQPPTLPKFTTQAPLTAAVGGGLTLGKSSTLQFNTGTSPSPGVMSEATVSVDSQQLKPTPTLGQGKVTLAPVISTPLKMPSQSPSPVLTVPQPSPVLSVPQPSSVLSIPQPSSVLSAPQPKAVESPRISKSPSPHTTVLGTPKAREVEDATLLNIISSAVLQFEEELEKHNSTQNSFEIGTMEEMGNIRQSLAEEGEWIEQMSSTTSELIGEITQLHYEVLQGFKLREEADAQISKSKNPRHFLSMQSRQLDPHSRKTLEDIRLKYQYLQSQIEEVNTRLHMDWITYTNAMKHKKTRDLPISETIYNALMKCHTLRTRQEREVELLCDRLKAFEIDSLSRGLQVNKQHNNDDVLASLERSLKEAKLTPSAYVSPVKMLSQGKQEKLQKILAQRNTIPVRKCSSIPKMKLADISTYELNHQNDLQESSSSLQSHSSSFSLYADSSFGPQKFSTPNRNSKVATEVADVGLVSDAGSSRTLLSGTKSGIINSQLRSAINSKVDNGFPLEKSLSSKSCGMLIGNGVDKGKAPVTSSLKIIKPVYEDITPPQTPDNKTDAGNKTASPLLALSSLVSKVPTTTAVETLSSASSSESKSIFADTQIVVPFSVVSTTSNPISFSFSKAPVSLTSVGTPTTLSKSSLPGASFTPLSTELSATPNKTENEKPLPQFTTANLSVNQILSASSSMPSTQIASTAVSFSVASAGAEGSSAGSMFPFKTSTPGLSANSGLFTFKLPTSSSSFSPAVTLSSDSTPSKSSFTAVPASNSSSIFGGALSTTLALSTVPSPVVTTPTFTSQTVKQTPDSNLLSSSSVLSAKVSKEGSIEANTLISGTQTSSDSATSSTATFGTSLLKTSEGNNLVTSDSSSISIPSTSSAVSSAGLFASSKSSNVADKTPTPEQTGSSLFGKAAGGLFNSGTLQTGSLFQNTTSSSTGSIFGGDSSSSTSVFGGSTKPSSLFKATETTSSGSMFGGSSTLSGSIFGTAKATETSSVFGGTSSTASIFGGASAASGNTLGSITISSVKSTEAAPSSTVTSVTGGTVSTPSQSSDGSLFGSVSATTTTVSSGTVYGGEMSVVSTTGPMFSVSTTSSTGTLFSPPTTSTTGTLFSPPSTSSTGTLFSPPSTSSTGTLFSPPSTSSTGTLFSPPSTSSTGTLFSPPSTSSTGTLFSPPSTSSTGTLFSPPSTSTTGTMFSPPSTSTTGTMFSAPTTSTTGTMFSAPTTSTPGTLFSAPSTSTTGTMFSAPTTSAPGTLFSASATSTAGSVFTLSGASASSGTSFGQPSAFGALSTSTSVSGFTPSLSLSITSTSSSTGGSIFGQKSESLFGQTTQSPASSLFGGPSTTGSVFGGTTATGSAFGGNTQPQGTSSVFGGSTATAAQGGSIFGGPSQQQSSGTSIFGQSVTSPASTSGGLGFGQTSAVASSPFSSTNTTTQEAASPFSSSGFGIGSSSSGSGGFFSGLGSKPNEENASKNIFGSTSFTAAKPELSLFGGQSSSTFGSGQATGSTFGTPQASSTGSTFGNPGFGGAASTGATGNDGTQGGGFGMTTPQKSSGFGSGATFGGAAVFGGTPSFSSPPKFGSSPAFGGSPAFGAMAGGGGAGGTGGTSGGGFSSFASSGGSTFGSVASSTPSGGFGGFSSQSNASTFGSVAQQSSGQQQQQQQQQQSSFGNSGTSFSGGSNFTSWR